MLSKLCACIGFLLVAFIGSNAMAEDICGEMWKLYDSSCTFASQTKEEWKKDRLEKMEQLIAKTKINSEEVFAACENSIGEFTSKLKEDGFRIAFCNGEGVKAAKKITVNCKKNHQKHIKFMTADGEVPLPYNKYKNLWCDGKDVFQVTEGTDRQKIKRLIADQVKASKERLKKEEERRLAEKAREEYYANLKKQDEEDSKRYEEERKRQAELVKRRIEEWNRGVE